MLFLQVGTVAIRTYIWHDEVEKVDRFEVYQGTLEWSGMRLTFLRVGLWVKLLPLVLSLRFMVVSLGLMVFGNKITLPIPQSFSLGI